VIESPLTESLPKQTPSLPGQQLLKVPLPKKAKGPVVPRPGLVEFLKSMDLEAFLDDWTTGEMKRRVVAKYGKRREDRVTASEFREARIEAFDFWKAIRLYPERSGARYPTHDQWEIIKRATSKSLVDMHGRTLRQCVRIVRKLCSCNAADLQGLPPRFHVWKKGPR